MFIESRVPKYLIKTLRSHEDINVHVGSVEITTVCWTPCEWARYMKTKFLTLGVPGPVRRDHTLRALFSRLRMVKGTERALLEAGVDLWGVRTGFLEEAAFSYFL